MSSRTGGPSRPDDDDGDCGFWWCQTRNSASSFGSLQIEGVGGSDVVSVSQTGHLEATDYVGQASRRYRRQSPERLRFTHSLCFTTKPLPKSDGLKLGTDWAPFAPSRPQWNESDNNPLTDRM